MYRFNRLFLFLCLVLVAVGAEASGEADPQQAAKDANVVEALLRLKGVDVNASPRLKAAVLRHLQVHRGTEKYVQLVDRLNVRGVGGELLRAAIEDSVGTTGVQAAALLLKRQEIGRFEQTLAGTDERAAAKAAEVLGFVGNDQAIRLLVPHVTKGSRRVVKVAVAAALGRNLNGQKLLLQFVQQGTLPVELNFAVANALYGSPDPEIRAAVAKHLKLPEAAGSMRLPPIAELMRLPGNAETLQRRLVAAGLRSTEVIEARVNKTLYYRVRVGPVREVSDVDGQVEKIRQLTGVTPRVERK